MSDIIRTVANPRAKLDRARSFLVFPGDDAHKRERALASGADAVVLDLEDGVPPAAKDEARAHLDGFARSRSDAVLLVRVNDPLGDVGRRDLDALPGGDEIALVVPKASPAAVDAAARAGRPVVALVEDARGIRDANLLAAHPAVVALALGSADLAASLAISPRADGIELLYPRSRLVVASAAAGLRAPVDGPCLAVRDDAAVERETRAACALGLRGKLCIHPAQIAAVHRALAPTREELEHARRVVAAWEETEAAGEAIAVVDGTLVDLPVAARARAVIAANEGSGTT